MAWSDSVIDFLPSFSTNQAGHSLHRKADTIHLGSFNSNVFKRWTRLTWSNSILEKKSTTKWNWTVCGCIAFSCIMARFTVWRRVAFVNSNRRLSTELIDLSIDCFAWWLSFDLATDKLSFFSFPPLCRLIDKMSGRFWPCLDPEGCHPVVPQDRHHHP